MTSRIIADSAIILAGGLGSRIRKLNPYRPKPMLLINNIPFLEYLLTYLLNLGIKVFILQVSYKYELIQNHFGNKFKGTKIFYEVENTPMGTGGGLIISEKKYNQGDILVINGDTLTEINYSDFFDFHKKNNHALSLICRDNNNLDTNLKFSLDINANIFFSKTNNTKINSGVYLIKKNTLKKFFQLKKSFISFENDILTPLIKEKKVFGYLQNKFFIDIGTPKDYKAAQTLIPDYFKNRHIL